MNPKDILIPSVVERYSFTITRNAAQSGAEALVPPQQHVVDPFATMVKPVNGFPSKETSGTFRRI